MNLKILFMILMYYSIFSLFFLVGGSTLVDDGYNNTISTGINSTDISDDELDAGGFFSSGVSFTRFLGLVTIGIGLPDDTPTWFNLFFFAWQTIITILSVGFIISSIWDG